jgi:hypothetical protein
MSANVTTNAEQQQLLQTVGEIRKSYEVYYTYWTITSLDIESIATFLGNARGV